MKTRSSLVWGFFVVLLCGSAVASAADRPADSDSTAPEAFEFDELKQLISESKTDRADFIEARRILRMQLAEAATVEERRTLLRLFWEQNRDMILTQRAMRRHFRQRQLEIRRERRDRIRDRATD